ncbi:MAG: TonB-dependent receptor [Bacteroidia bacterium]
MRRLFPYFIALPLAIFLFCPLSAQYKVEGTIISEDASLPLEFATITLIKSDDSVTVSGTVTDHNGAFSIQAGKGNYLIKSSFLGYQIYFSAPFVLDEQHASVVLPPISLSPQPTTLDEVEITSEKSMVEMSMDKKIFRVGQDLSTSGANASEILGNIPSVSVDAEGQVKLRGSADVRILIDGKPSGMASAKGLQQLQGSLVESIEIITNPSARYEAEGNSGIINIVLKKEKQKGLNGSFELITGEPANYGVSLNINYRVKKFNFFINYGVSYRVLPNRNILYQEVYRNDTTFITEQSSAGRREGINNNIRGGLDYYFNDKNILTASYRFQRDDGKRITDISYLDYLNTTANQVSTSLRDQYELEKEPYSEYVLSYKKLFTKKNHEFNADARYLNYWENSDQLFTENTFLPSQTKEQGTISRQRAVNDEYENQYLIQMDYVQPIGKEGKIETGIRSSFREMTNDYVVTQESNPEEWVVLPELDNVFVYNENIHAAYGIIGNKMNKISYQAGLRAEATDVKTTLEKTNEVNPRNYANLFPSAHLAYHLPGNSDIQISYSRRVRRPEYRDLSPFITLSDRRNFFSGNPDLNPEFTHSLEVGHLKYFENGSISSSLYYRNSAGTIQGIRRVNEEGLSTSLPENLAGQQVFGADVAFAYTLFPWWKLDANGNFFRAITDGTNIDATFSSDTYSWFVRQTSKFTLSKQISIQFRGNYEAPELMPQGRRKALYYFDFAIQKDLWNKKGRLTLNVMDILNSRKMRTVIEGETFYTERTSQYQRRQINLTLSYRLRQ